MTIGRLFKILFIAISLLTASVLSVGCEDSPSISTPDSVTAPSSESAANFPASEYPADIIGRVTIAEHVQIKQRDTGETIITTPKEGQIFWIINISVKNKSYQDAIEALLTDWIIIANEKVNNTQNLVTDIQQAYRMTVTTGATGETTIRFSVTNTLKVSDAELCYQGQEPYSYGKLTGGDMVAMYDWDSKTVIKEQQPKQQSVFFDKWEFTLKSYSISSNNIDVNIAVTSHFNTPSTYQLSDLGGIVCIDQYGKVFGDTIEEDIIIQNLRDFKNNPSDYLLGIKEYKDECFFDGEYYPGDTKVGNLKFVVNQKSGKISLWLYCKSHNPIKLFDLGEVE